jgi:hypothetical protein
MSAPNVPLDTPAEGVNINESMKATQADEGGAFQVVDKRGTSLDAANRTYR